MQPPTSNQHNRTTSPQAIPDDILNHPDRRIRLPETKVLTGFCTSSIYAKMKDGTFPAAQKIGGRAVAWRLGDILEFLNSRPSTIKQQKAVA